MTRDALISLLEGHGLHVVRDKCTSQEVTILCPQCADVAGHRGVNVRTLATNCFRCGNGGGLLHWAQKIGVAIDLGDETPIGIGLDEMQSLLDQIETATEPVSPSGYIPEVKLPHGFTL